MYSLLEEVFFNLKMCLSEINLFACTCVKSETQESEGINGFESEAVFCFYNESFLLNFLWEMEALV